MIPAIPLLDKYAEDTRQWSEETYTGHSTAVLFTVAKEEKQPKQTRTDSWIKTDGVHAQQQVTLEGSRLLCETERKRLKVV